jgi:hypothetical protein
VRTAGGPVLAQYLGILYLSDGSATSSPTASAVAECIGGTSDADRGRTSSTTSDVREVVCPDVDAYSVDVERALTFIQSKTAIRWDEQISGGAVVGVTISRRSAKAPFEIRRLIQEMSLANHQVAHPGWPRKADVVETLAILGELRSRPLSASCPAVSRMFKRLGLLRRFGLW